MDGTVRRAVERLRPRSLLPGDATVRQRVFYRQPLLNRCAYWWTKRALARRQSGERTPDDVLDTVLECEPGWDPYRVTALQYRDELEAFVRFLEAREPETALEIGLFQGGTLYVWARALDSVGHVTCVDAPVWNEMVHRRRSRLYSTFSDAVDVDVIYGDSHDESTYEEVVEATGGSVDFLFVDGDHSYDGVKRDFETYREVVSEDGVVAFHDIRRHATDDGQKSDRLRHAEGLRERHVSVGRERWNGVSQFWSEIEDEYTTHEFLTHPQQMGAGIGVVEF